MKGVICLLAFVLVALGNAEERVRFDGQKVIRAWVDSTEQMENLQKVIGDETDIWSRESVLGLGANDIRVDSKMEMQIRKLGLKVEIFVEDLQNLIDEERNETIKNAHADDWFTAYHTYDDIVAYMQQLASSYPNIAKYIPSIGTTIQGRSIPALRINGTASSQRIWFNGGQHAREWIGPATVLYLATQLLEQYDTNSIVSNLVDSVEFDIVPLVNPDGYMYAWTTNRLWRKNRRNNGGGVYGVDLNRNWNDHWGGAGSSGVPSSDTYRGTAAFSEPESSAVSDYISSLPNILAGIDFHSYSQLILRPYGWTNANCPDEQALSIIGEGVSITIAEIFGTQFESIKSISLYVTTGSASDWFYAAGIWGAYTIELRDTGKYGFVLPPSQIVPSGQEAWNGMLYFWQTVLDTHPGFNA